MHVGTRREYIIYIKTESLFHPSSNIAALLLQIVIIRKNCEIVSAQSIHIYSFKIHDRETN